MNFEFVRTGVLIDVVKGHPALIEVDPIRHHHDAAFAHWVEELFQARGQDQVMAYLQSLWLIGPALPGGAAALAGEATGIVALRRHWCLLLLEIQMGRRMGLAGHCSLF